MQGQAHSPHLSPPPMFLGIPEMRDPEIRRQVEEYERKQREQAERERAERAERGEHEPRHPDREHEDAEDNPGHDHWRDWHGEGVPPR